MCNPITTLNPDKLLEKGVTEGFEWEVTANGRGYRCGYVRIPAGHPWHGKDYGEIEADVHGGLTFAHPDEHCGKGEDDAWWIGFDCAHAQDAPDPDLPGYRKEWDLGGTYDPGVMPFATIKSTPYVAAECRQLAEQALIAASF